MKSDPELDALVASLRDDLPSEQDSARLRARLSALGLASTHALVSTSAAAAAARVQGTASSASSTQAASLGAAAGKVAAQAGAVSWVVKAGVVLVATASAVAAGPVWLAHTGSSSVTPAENRAGASSPQSAANQQRGQQTQGSSANRAAASSSRAPAQLGPSERVDLAPIDEARFAAPSESLTARSVVARATELEPSTHSLSAAPIPTGALTEAAAPAPAPPGGDTEIDRAAAASTAGFAKDDEGNASASAHAAPAIEPTTLRAETVLIDGALAALRKGDSPRALSLLSEHRRRFPNGLLTQERERAIRKMSELRTQRSTP